MVSADDRKLNYILCYPPFLNRKLIDKYRTYEQ